MAGQKNIGFLMVLAAALVVSGCLESKTVVTVEKDGSGTVEQTVYYPEMDFGAAGFEFSVEGEEAEGFDFGDAVQQPSEEEELAKMRAEAEKTAASMGEGVTLQSVEALPPRDGRKGVRIVYAFEDINKIRIDPLPEMTLSLSGGMQIGGAGGGGFGSEDFGGNKVGGGDFPAEGQVGDSTSPAPAQENEKIRFAFTAQPKPTLTIFTPEMTAPSGAQPVEDDDPQAKAMAAMMMKQMFDGMLLEFRVRLKGQLTDTNATYASRKFNAVGLYRMDFDKLAENQAALNKLLSMDSTADAETVKKQLQEPVLARYLKLEMQDRVDVSFE